MGDKDKTKPRRHKKRKSRTEVSSGSESEYEKEPEEVISQPAPQPKASNPVIEQKPKPETEAETEAAFTSFYMQRATEEFAGDLDRVRGAGDFKGDALEILIDALKQGTALFSPAEQKRVVDKGLTDR